MTHSHVWHDHGARTLGIHHLPHSCVWHDSFICVPELFHTHDMTHSYVWRDSFICVKWLIHVWHDSFICDMTHSYATWLIHMCDMTHSYVWRISDMTRSHVCVTYLVQHMTHSHVTWLIHVCDLFLALLVHTCDTSRSNVWHNALTLYSSSPSYECIMSLTWYRVAKPRRSFPAKEPSIIPQKILIISGSFAERDLQLKACYMS